jgi:transforming growth factor-beta-induced protein
MVSTGPYSQSNNFTHMFDFVDLRGNSSREQDNNNSLMGVINNNPNFSKFKYIVERARMNTTLSDPQSDFTLFIPLDTFISRLEVESMDISIARNIVRSAMLDRKITSELLEDSNASYFFTKSKSNNLFINNMNGITYINDDIRIIQKDIITDNGIIHVIDNIILPSFFYD